MSMRVDVLIIGQGLAGTFLAHFLRKSGLSFFIFDEPRSFSASRAASGIINPITGRRLVKTWMIEELMSFAQVAYGELQLELSVNCMTSTQIIDFFTTAQMRIAFLRRLEDDPSFLRIPEHENCWRERFQYQFGYGIIEPVFLVHISDLLNTFRREIEKKGHLAEETMDFGRLEVRPEAIRYKDINASYVIFCDGIGSLSIPYFKSLPFAPNKGEAVIAEIRDWGNESVIFKRGLYIVPMGEGRQWIGSSYSWEYSDDRPTEAFLKNTEAVLKSWIKNNYRIVEHFASIRPATVERRPFVGFHPQFRNVGILNGLGTKGCSLAPYFAAQIASHIAKGTRIDPEADVNRFARVLTRK